MRPVRDNPATSPAILAAFHRTDNRAAHAVRAPAPTLPCIAPRTSHPNPDAPAETKKGAEAPFLVRPARVRRRPVQLESGAGNETRTRDLNLGKVALYQLSYSRVVVRILPIVPTIVKKKLHASRDAVSRLDASRFHAITHALAITASSPGRPWRMRARTPDRHPGCPARTSRNVAPARRAVARPAAGPLARPRGACSASRAAAAIGRLRVPIARAGGDPRPPLTPPACRLFDGDRRRDGRPEAFSMNAAAASPGTPAAAGLGHGNEKTPAWAGVSSDLERETRLELATSTLARLRSTN